MKNYNMKSAALGTMLFLAFAPFAQAAVAVNGSASESGGESSDSMTLDTHTNAGVTVSTEGERKDGEGGSMGSEANKEDGSRGEKPEKPERPEKMKAGIRVGGEGEHSTGIERAKEVANEHADEALKSAELHIDVVALLKSDNGNGTSTIEGTSSATVQLEAKDVHSTADLKHFIAAKARGDAHLKQVELKDGKVEVQYEEPAEWFGFINTTVPTNVSVDAKGDVQVTYPWYHIFMKKTVSRASIQSDIARALAAEKKAAGEGVATSSMSATTSMQATIATGLGIPNIFEIIANSLRGAYVKGEAAIQ